MGSGALLDPSEIQVECHTSVEVNDLVYISNGVFKRAKSDDILTMPAQAQVTRKSGSTTCYINHIFIQKNLTSIEDGKTYFVSETDAGKTQTIVPTTKGHIRQPVATGLGTDKKLININPDNMVIR